MLANSRFVKFMDYAFLCVYLKVDFDMLSLESHRF